MADTVIKNLKPNKNKQITVYQLSKAKYEIHTHSQMQQKSHLHEHQWQMPAKIWYKINMVSMTIVWHKLNNLEKFLQRNILKHYIYMIVNTRIVIALIYGKVQFRKGQGRFPLTRFSTTHNRFPLTIWYEIFKGYIILIN